MWISKGGDFLSWPKDKSWSKLKSLLVYREMIGMWISKQNVNKHKFGTCEKLHDFPHSTRQVFHELIGLFTHTWANALSLSPSMYVWIYTYKNISLKTMYNIYIYIYLSTYLYV